MADRVSNIRVEDAGVGVSVGRKAVINNVTAENSGVGVHLTVGSSGSIISGGLARNCTVGFQIGGELPSKEKLQTLFELQPTLIMANIKDIEEAHRAVSQTAGEEKKIEILKNTKLGNWLAKQKFTDWARLASDLARFFVD